MDKIFVNLFDLLIVNNNYNFAILNDIKYIIIRNHTNYNNIISSYNHNKNIRDCVECACYPLFAIYLRNITQLYFIQQDKREEKYEEIIIFKF